MGRAIDTENAIDELKIKVEKLENIVLGMSNVLDKVEERVLGKEKKETSKNGKKKTNNKRNTKSGKQSNNGKTDVNSKASKSWISSWLLLWIKRWEGRCA